MTRIMKKNIFSILILLAGLFMLQSCYDDKGGNDYDTALPDVEIVIPETTYSGSLGQSIKITPTIKTMIDAADLEYHWEVDGNITNSQGRGTFSPLVNDDQQGESLNYVCKLDSNITTLNKSYNCRLRVHQKSTGRDFYSADLFTITIEGITGLMVLYDEGNSCDVGILCADEFMPKSSSIPENPTVTMGVFSNANKGKKLSGKGLEVYQGIASYVSSNARDRMRILVRTDQEAYWLNRNDLSVLGNWNYVFYLKGDRKQNEGVANGYILDDSWGVAFDGNDVFMMEPAKVEKYLFPTFTPNIDLQGHNMTFAPIVQTVGTSGIQRLMYANSVDGDSNKRGFVAITNGSLDNLARYTKWLDTGTDQVAFNPGDMKADLVKITTDAREHAVAVMKGLSTHPQYAGKYFLADLNPAAAVSGESSYAGIPVCLCDMSGLTDVDNAIAFDFGTTINMYYYATKNSIYRYGLDGKTLTPSQPLCMTDGSAIQLDGEVTMMKMLNQANVKRHDSDEILLVATYNGSKSAIYAFHLDMMTGNVVKSAKYSADNVQNWNFGKIYDVNIKSL